MSLIGRNSDVSKTGPGSLLPKAGPRPGAKSGPEVSAISPSELLPVSPAPGSDPLGEVSKHGPGSLLPEDVRSDNQRSPELSAISPSELDPIQPTKAPFRLRRSHVVWAAAPAAAIILSVVLANRISQESVPQLLQEAEVAARAGDRMTAGIHLKNALALAPSNRELRVRHGLLLLEGGDFAGALDEFIKAQELGAPREQVMPLLARTLIARREYQAALDVTAPLPGQNADAPSLIAQRAHAMFYLGRYEQARQAYQAALSAEPAQTDALLGEARLAIVEKKHDMALTMVEKAVASGPRNADALSLLGDLKRVHGDEAGAAIAYEQAVTITPSAHAVRLSLASVLIGQDAYDKAVAQIAVVLKGVPDSPTANFLYSMIEFKRGRYVEARNLAVKVLNVQGSHTPSLLIVGASAFVGRDYPVAEKALTQALVRAPNNVYARKLLGASLVRTRQSRAAIEELTPLLKRIPNDRDLLATLGEAYLDLNDFNRATGFLERAASIDPKDPGVRVQLGRSRLAAGELDRAVAELETANVLSPQLREARVLLAMTHLRRREFDRVVQSIDELKDSVAKNPVALNLLGAAYVGKKDFVSATRRFEQAVAIDPAYMPAVINLVQVDLLERDDRAAIRRLEKAVQHSPQNMRAMLTLGSLLSTRRETQEDALRWIERAVQSHTGSAEPLLALARFHLQRGANKAALEATGRALQTSISSVEMLDSLGQLQVQAGSARQALDTYIRLVSENPDLPIAHLRLGLVQAQVGNAAAARQSLRKAIELDPNGFEATSHLAQVEAKIGNIPVALALAEEVILKLPKSSVGYSVKGDVLVHAKRYVEAIPAFERAFAYQRTPVFALKLHQAHAFAGSIERGEKMVDDWLRENPKDWATRRFIADFSFGVRRFRVAQAHYEALVAAYPKEQQLLNNLALAYDALDDSRAIRTAEQAYLLNPHNPYVADTLGWLLVRAGRIEKARELLKEAVERAPEIPDIRYHYGVALAKWGQRKEARSELERAFSLRGRVSQEAEAKALLESLRN